MRVNGFFNILTPVIYWLLFIVWTVIFVIFVKRVKGKNIKDTLLTTLFLILSLDALRTLLESLYFGIRYTSYSGLINRSFFEFLSKPYIVLIPKGLNLAVAFIILLVFIRKWIPQESSRLMQYQKVLNNNQLLLNQLPVSVVITDLDGHIEYVNQKFIDLTGYAADELMGNTPSVLTSEKNTITDYRDLWETIRRGETWKGRFLNRKKNGELYYEDAVISPIFNDQGEMTNFMGIKEDVTASVEMYNAYEKIHTVVEQTHDSVEIIDLDGRIEYVNAAFVNTTGYSKEEVIGKNPLDLFWDGKRNNPDVEKELWDTVNAGKPWTGRFTNKIKDGSYIIEELSIAPVFSKSGEIINYASVKRDITKQIEAEEEQKYIKEQLFHAQKVESVGQLAGGVAHDFNNILSGIITAASLLNDPARNLDEKSRKYVDMIMKSSSRAADLTNSLLSISRRGRSEAKTFSVVDVLKETTGLLHFTVDKKIQITTSLEMTNDRVYGDQSALQSTLLNLGINASHAISGYGSIDYLLTNQFLDEEYCRNSEFSLQPGYYCRLEVRDNGSGIPQEYLSHIFEPFFTTKDSGKGTGLGLSSAMKIVKEFKGEITVESELGKGSVFTLMIPVSSEDEKDQISQEALSGTETILIVDDEEFNRTLGKEILESLGYTVLLASDGKEALSIYSDSRDKVDLIILDMNMPVLDGRDTFIKIREIDRKMKVIIASGYADDKKIQELYRHGLQYFIAKPYRISDFSQLIRKVLDG